MMRNPGVVSMNGHRVKVQRWQSDANTITFTTVVRGENLANDIAATVTNSTVELIIDSEPALSGRAELLNRRVNGAGPTAVVRLEILFEIDDGNEAATELTVDQKLDAILSELHELRREVAALRSGKSHPSAGGSSLQRPGMTMLDFEIPVEEESS